MNNMETQNNVVSYTNNGEFLLQPLFLGQVESEYVDIMSSMELLSIQEFESSDSVPISAEEVRTQLKCLPGSSAPGPDRLPYKVWKAIDPSGSILSKILEICRLHKRIPKSWKESTTILLYKKGDQSVPSNWRPISLQNAVYKIYAALWAKRLASWPSEAEIISPCQKGFMPGEGCSEHSFLLRSLMEDARRNHKSLYSVWFDLKNAFGSIPHDLLWFSMRQVGVPGEIIDVVRDIYQGSSFRVLSGDNNMTDSIPQVRGVKQGCPLSPLIFNIAIEGLLCGIMSCPAEGYSFGKGFEVKSLAYADDLTIVAKTDAAIRAMIAQIEEFASWAGLCFNVTKCASLSTGYMSGKRIVFPSTFTLNGNTIPVMKWEDRYRHLGVLLGANPEAHLDQLAKDFKMDDESLFQSPLADWMKLEAFKEFVMPKLDYVFRTTLAHKKWAKLSDRHVRSSIKRSLGLPQRTCDAFFYPSMTSGGLGLRCIEDDLGSLMITQAVKMLTSPDPLIREMAQHSLNLTIQKRCGGVEGPEDRWRYLSGQLSRVKKHSDVSTIWSRVKAFCSDRNIRLCGGGENCPPSSITMADQVLGSHLRENLLRRLRDGRAKHWLHLWTLQCM